MNIPLTLGMIRAYAGYTQEQVAEEFGVKQSTVAAWETRGIKDEARLKALSLFYDAELEAVRTASANTYKPSHRRRQIRESSPTHHPRKNIAKIE